MRSAGEHSEAVVRPFVLGVEANWRRREAETEAVEVSLIGKAERCWAYVVHALREGAARGLGVERVPLSLDSVEQETSTRNCWRAVLDGDQHMSVEAARTPAVTPMPESVRIRIITPLRIRRQNDLVVPGRLGFGELTAAVLRRLALLARQHTDTAWRMDHAKLRGLAERATVQRCQLHWQDWARYSSRQETHVPMGGIVGEMDIRTEGLDDLWPLLWVGQWTHAGKGASMGLGRYEVDSL